MSGRGDGGGSGSRRNGPCSDGPPRGGGRGDGLQLDWPDRGGPRGANLRPPRLTYEEKVASDMQYARLRLAKLQERHAQRQELLGQLQQENEAQAVQCAQRTAAELGKSAAGKQQAAEQQQEGGPR